MSTAAHEIAPQEPQPSLDEQVELEVLDMVARGLLEGFALGFVPLALVTALLQFVHAPAHLAAWAAIVAIVLALGVMLSAYYRRHPAGSENAAAWRRRLHFVVTASGLTWGAAGYLFVPAPWQVEIIVLALLTSLAAAVLANIGASLSHYLLFVTGALLPTAIHRATLGGATNLALASGALLTAIVLAVFAARLATATRRSLRVGHENRRLAQALEQRTREAERASRDKSRFIAAASHDLRQPVHALGLLLDVLRGQALSPQADTTAARMSQVLDTLESLFTGLLDISRLDSGAIEPRRADFALQPLLDGLVDELEPQAQSKGLALRCRRTDAWVRSDPVLIGRILRNLLANAVRYTERGGILVACRRRRDGWAIEVRDSGVGIALADQAAIFEEFHQVADEGRHGAQRGLGLGLAIVRRLGRLLDHPVSLRSCPGRGSVFRVMVPHAPAQARTSADTQRPLEPRISAPGTRARRALVVDDDDHARDALAGWLRAWGCEVTACAGSDDATAAIASLRQAPDMLITDWRLPGAADGLEVVRRVRAAFGSKVAAILITGDALDDARRLARAHGVVLLHKPVRPAALRAALISQGPPVPDAPSERARHIP